MPKIHPDNSISEFSEFSVSEFSEDSEYVEDAESVPMDLLSLRMLADFSKQMVTFELWQRLEFRSSLHKRIRSLQVFEELITTMEYRTHFCLFLRLLMQIAADTAHFEGNLYSGLENGYFDSNYYPGPVFNSHCFVAAKYHMIRWNYWQGIQADSGVVGGGGVL